MAMEDFTPAERKALAPYFTNIDRPVFAPREPARDGEGRALARYSPVGEVAAPPLPG